MRLRVCNCILIQSQLGRHELATRRGSSDASLLPPKVGSRQRQMLTDKPISPHKLLSTLSWEKAAGRRQQANRLTGNCQLTLSASASATTTTTDTRRRHYAKPAKRQIKNANAVSHRGRRVAEKVDFWGKGMRHLSSLHPIIKGQLLTQPAANGRRNSRKKLRYFCSKNNILKILNKAKNKIWIFMTILLIINKN